MSQHELNNGLIRLGFALFVSGALICLASAGCKKSKPAEDPLKFEMTGDPSRYLGTYRLEPSASKAKITLNRNGTVAYVSDNPARLDGVFTINNEVLRIYVTFPQASAANEPIGIFLISDFHPDGWRGRWQGETRKLRKNAPAKPNG